MKKLRRFPLLISLSLLLNLLFLSSCKKENIGKDLFPYVQVTNGFPKDNVVYYSISGDGRYLVVVTYEKYSAADTDNFTDVYRYDRQDGSWLLVSTNLVSNAFSASVSDDGSKILYTCSQHPDIPYSPTAIYLWTNGLIEAVQEGAQSPISPITMYEPLVAFTNVISPDGGTIGVNVDLNHYVITLATGAFQIISNGQPVDFSTNGQVHSWVDVDILGSQSPSVWLYDRGAGSNLPITNGTKYADNPRLSGNGNLMIFQTETGNLTGAEDANGLSDIFVYDRTVHRYTRLSPVDANGPSQGPDISADGAVACFYSSANNMGVPDDNFVDDVFVMIDGNLVNLTSGSDGESHSPILSNDGRYLAFVSSATNLTDANPGTGYNIFLVGPLR